VKHAGKATTGFLLTVFLLWFVLKDVDFASVLANIATGDMLLLSASVFVATFGFVIRAVRWRVLLLPVLPASRMRSRFAAVAIGFMANNILPARIGEFARPYALSRLEPVSITAAFGSLVVERFMDGVILLIFLVIPVFTPFFPDVAAVFEGGGLAIFQGAVALVLGVLVVLVLMATLPKQFLAAARVALKVLPEVWSLRATQLLEGLLQSMAIMREPRLLALGFAWSLFFWTWHGLSFWLGMLAFDIDTGWLSAMFTEAVVGFGVALPSAPGFFGTFHASAHFALTTVYGVAEEQSLAFAFAYHFGGWIPITAIGLWFTWKLGFSLGDIGSAPQQIQVES
jgi:hypothetical protein